MSSRSPKAKRAASRRPNKAQQRASQVRAAQTVVAPPVVRQPEPEHETPPSAVTNARPARRERSTSRPNVRPRPVQSRAAARPVGLTRAQEYAAIRADLVRLLVTFGVLMVVMLLLLLVIEQ